MVSSDYGPREKVTTRLVRYLRMALLEKKKNVIIRPSGESFPPSVESVDACMTK